MTPRAVPALGAAIVLAGRPVRGIASRAVAGSLPASGGGLTGGEDPWLEAEPRAMTWPTKQQGTAIGLGSS
jgi:hypothetical protein